MSAAVEYNPVMILDKYRKMMLDLLDEVFDVVDVLMDDAIKKKQKKIDSLKWNFPIEYKKDPAKKGSLTKDIDDQKKGIIKLKIDRDKVQMSWWYFKQGIQVAFNEVMLVYGMAALKTPGIALKGSGDIVMEADQDSHLYISKAQEVGTPTPAVTESVDKAAFFAKIATIVVKRGKEGYELEEEAKEAFKKEKKEK